MKIEWYAFRPEDTLVVKAASPSELGEGHRYQAIFPPPVSTVSGALRTAVLVQNEIPFRHYIQGKADGRSEVQTIGKAGSPAPFSVMGPLFQRGDKLFVPSPYNWFADKAELSRGNGEVQIYKTEESKSPLLKSSAGDILHMAKGASTDISSIGGHWLLLDDLFSSKTRKQVFPVETFYSTEERTGIALGPSRQVRKSHLYSLVHFRLHSDVRLIYGASAALPLPETGSLILGAEKRISYYQKISIANLPGNQNSSAYLALSMVMGSDESNAAVVATGKPQYIGGWDMKRRFHKPMRAFFPAGTVFTKNINKNCIAF